MKNTHAQYDFDDDFDDDDFDDDDENDDVSSSCFRRTRRTKKQRMGDGVKVVYVYVEEALLFSKTEWIVLEEEEEKKTKKTKRPTPPGVARNDKTRRRRGGRGGKKVEENDDDDDDVVSFRPCIDIHRGRVKQIVKSSLRDEKWSKKRRRKRKFETDVNRANSRRCTNATRFWRPRDFTQQRRGDETSGYRSYESVSRGLQIEAADAGTGRGVSRQRRQPRHRDELRVSRR